MSRRNPFVKKKINGKTVRVWRSPSAEESAQLDADIAVYSARDWAKILKAYFKNPKDFYASWYFLSEHPANKRTWKSKDGRHVDVYSAWSRNLDIMIVKVDPKTRRIESKVNKNWKKNGKGKHPEDKKRNTATDVWLEWGPWSTTPECGNTPAWDGPSHDPRCDVGAPTFEEAIVKLAAAVWKGYGIQTDYIEEVEDAE